MGDVIRPLRDYEANQSKLECNQEGIDEVEAYLPLHIIPNVKSNEVGTSFSAVYPSPNDIVTNKDALDVELKLAQLHQL